jgi:hypothetical protein
MRFFTSPTTINRSEDRGPAVLLKPSRWKKLFRKRRRSPSLSSALSESFGELESVPSIDNFRVIGNVEEIVFRDGTPESQSLRSESAVCSREPSVENLNQVIKRELFSDRNIFLDALDGHERDMQRNDTMMSIYVDAVDGNEKLELKDNMEVTVVAEVHDGIVRRNNDSDNRSSDNYGG